MLIKNITLKECVLTVTINMEEQRNHGIVHMENYTQSVSAKTVILINIIM